MSYLFIRPAIGWTGWFLVHAIGIPLVYGFGKAFSSKEGQSKQPLATTNPSSGNANG